MIDVNGERYDWRETREPERPYIHQYHTTLVDKILLCTKPDPTTGAPSKVYATFEDALERIRKIDNLTRGIPKIMYLVGWQREGHDSKYPDMSEVNKLLKRPGDATAADSLRWLMAEGSRFNTTVSFHINMTDAYKNSPLWDEYERAGLICTEGGMWGGEQSYLIDSAKEWDAGLSARRIDELIDLLPIERAGTIHIDAFWPGSQDKVAQVAAMRKIIRYWRDRGIDVTTEALLSHTGFDNGLVGLSPMAWHIAHEGWGCDDEFTEEQYMDIPASLFCPTRDHSPRRLVFGAGMQGEGIRDDALADYLEQFCLETLPWQYLNRHDRAEYSRDGDIGELRFSDGMISRADFAEGTSTITKGDIVVREGGDVFVPALWRDEREIIAFSKSGYAGRRWTLPAGWEDVERVSAGTITIDGLTNSREIPVVDSSVELTLSPGEAVSIQTDQAAM